MTGHGEIGALDSGPYLVKGSDAMMPTTRRVAGAKLPTRYGAFEMFVYEAPGRKEHVALTLGAIDAGGPVLVRAHSECLTGDVLGSSRCDCGEQLDDSLRYLQEHGRGVLLYLRQEGRGIGLPARSPPTRSRSGDWIRSRRTSPWACRRTCATTGPPPRCCSTSEFDGSAF